MGDQKKKRISRETDRQTDREEGPKMSVSGNLKGIHGFLGSASMMRSHTPH